MYSPPNGSGIDDPYLVGAYGHYYSVLVHQATGMVAVQAGCAIPAALGLFVNHAAQQESTVNEIASAVINQRLRFDSRQGKSTS